MVVWVGTGCLFGALSDCLVGSQPVKTSWLGQDRICERVHASFPLTPFSKLLSLLS